MHEQNEKFHKGMETFFFFLRKQQPTVEKIFKLNNSIDFFSELNSIMQ